MKNWIDNLTETEAKEQLERADDLLLVLVPHVLGESNEGDELRLPLLLASTYRKYVFAAIEAQSRSE